MLLLAVVVATWQQEVIQLEALVTSKHHRHWTTNILIPHSLPSDPLHRPLTTLLRRDPLSDWHLSCLRQTRVQDHREQHPLPLPPLTTPQRHSLLLEEEVTLHTSHPLLPLHRLMNSPHCITKRNRTHIDTSTRQQHKVTLPSLSPSKSQSSYSL